MENKINLEGYDCEEFNKKIRGYELTLMNFFKDTKGIPVYTDFNDELNEYIDNPVNQIDRDGDEFSLLEKTLLLASDQSIVFDVGDKKYTISWDYEPCHGDFRLYKLKEKQIAIVSPVAQVALHPCTEVEND